MFYIYTTPKYVYIIPAFSCRQMLYFVCMCSRARMYVYMHIYIYIYIYR